MFKFITRQHFIVNLLVAIGLLIGLLFLFLWMLGFITRHNQYEKVPSVIGLTVKEAVRELENKGFRVEVQDSVWDAGTAPLSVLKQSPEGDHMAKKGRQIYLTINRSQPPLIEMPNLIGLSFRNAELFLSQYGLVLADTTRKPDIARDAVLEQHFNGRPIGPGTRIFIGSRISLVLGSGLGMEEFVVPDLFGMTYREALVALETMGLNIGALLADAGVRDTANAFIYRQNPNVTTPLPDGRKQTNKIRIGQSIDVWVSATKRERELTPEEESGDDSPMNFDE